MFYIIGLGLGDLKDITVKGLEIVRKCEKIYLESYTSVLNIDIQSMENYYGKKIHIADRELVENGGDDILKESIKSNIALLVVGDPFGATTHMDLILRAKESRIGYEVVHNASIVNAVGCTGLQLYSFGETVSIPFWTDTWQPDSFYDKIVSNYTRNLHTLCLLDIRIKEPTLESLTKKKREYEPTRFMTVNTAADQIMRIINKKIAEKESPGIDGNSLSVGVARVGSSDQAIIACTINQMRNVDIGGPLHSLIITAKDLHPLEMDYLRIFNVQNK